MDKENVVCQAQWFIVIPATLEDHSSRLAQGKSWGDTMSTETQGIMMLHKLYGML
jgi:hypothetical protein